MIEESKEVTKKTKCNKASGISKYSLKPLKHACSTCGKKWRTSAELKTHVKSHSNLRPYMCEKCGQAYKHKHALEIHVGMHNGINPFQCSFCNKCFTQKGALMRHLPMHTGETPYQCELCGKRFVHHTSYNMHALSHTGKKSYKCHVRFTLMNRTLFSYGKIETNSKFKTTVRRKAIILDSKVPRNSAIPVLLEFFWRIVVPNFEPVPIVRQSAC